jgi:hypothetical protein
MIYRTAFWAQSLDNKSPDQFVTHGIKDGDSMEVRQGIVLAMSLVREKGRKVYDNGTSRIYAYAKVPAPLNFLRAPRSEWLLSVTPVDSDAAERASPVTCYVLKEVSRAEADVSTTPTPSGEGGFSRRFTADLRSFLETIATSSAPAAPKVPGRRLEESHYEILDAVVQVLDSLTGTGGVLKFFKDMVGGSKLLLAIPLFLILGVVIVLSLVKF